ncbi:hypothetical protein [Flavobacterium sp. K5-23]|uniref:hypothetical protein n=1 Tax=Flavobacterium sp. K5-23 TaxID=2746225 RepID=UPI00200D895F|nr:hypothetical protein [Flavobacterium sp. K5-23]UQD55850.1 hypothetical protein FLAK523_05335 [Flavobacterium sp. K5-23]
MSIQIQYNAGVYEINGLLNSQNCVYLKNHFEILMKNSRGVVLSLDKIVDIDCYSVNSIVSMCKKAFVDNKSFYIIGSKNKKVFEQFSALQLNDFLL